MGHKRYVIKNGKIYGPYLYESYREHGKVRKRYLGRHRDIKRANFPFVVVMALLMLVSLFMFVSIFLRKFF
jgi:hypothetical protein